MLKSSGEMEGEEVVLSSEEEAKRVFEEFK
jgi:hypothetical protein